MSELDKMLQMGVLVLMANELDKHCSCALCGEFVGISEELPLFCNECKKETQDVDNDRR